MQRIDKIYLQLSQKLEPCLAEQGRMNFRNSTQNPESWHLCFLGISHQGLGWNSSTDIPLSNMQRIIETPDCRQRSALNPSSKAILFPLCCLLLLLIINVAMWRINRFSSAMFEQLFQEFNHITSI